MRAARDPGDTIHRSATQRVSFKQLDGRTMARIRYGRRLVHPRLHSIASDGVMASPPSTADVRQGAGSWRQPSGSSPVRSYSGDGQPWRGAGWAKRCPSLYWSAIRRTHVSSGGGEDHAQLEPVGSAGTARAGQQPLHGGAQRVGVVAPRQLAEFASGRSPGSVSRSVVHQRSASSTASHTVRPSRCVDDR